MRLPLQLIAALALLYVGNHDGDAFLKSWVNHEEGYRTYLSILTYDWDDMPQTVPPESLLRSPQIDALYLDLLRQSEYFGFAPQLVVKCGLAEDHPNDVLPILVDLLSNRDSDLRSNADEGLRRLTGQDFGYNAQELVTQQSAAIAKWRAYVEEYLRTGGA